MEGVIDVPGLLAHQRLLDDHDQSLSCLRVTQLQSQFFRYILDILQRLQLRDFCME
jgi:hypothetical protein